MGELGADVRYLSLLILATDYEMIDGPALKPLACKAPE